jgi:hypothetical protein
MSTALVSSATNAPTINLTAFYNSAKIVITAGGTATTVTALSITGQLLTAVGQSVQFVSGGTPVVVHPSIAAEFVPSTAAASALAEWTVMAASGGGFEVQGWPTLSGTVENLFPTQVARKVTDPVDIILGKTYSGSGPDYLIRTISTTVDMGAAHWTTTYGLQRYTPDVTLLVLDTGHLDGGDASLGL